jgi:hypothetical protein
MMAMIEARAKELGARELAYRFVCHAQWEVTNDRSVIMSKSLSVVITV